MPPVIAFGSGITLQAVLNILHDARIPSFAVCPESDFVRRSRWFRSLPGAHGGARVEDLRPLLEELSIPEAMLLPCSDDWLRAVASLPEKLATRFPSSTPTNWVETLVDKWRFAQLLSHLNIPRPRTVLITSREELAELPEFEEAILKPLSSVDFACRHGVKGYVVANRREALEALERIALPILLQEFVPGPPTAGYFLDGFRDRTGSITALLARRRLRMYPAKLGNSTVTESVPLAEVGDAQLFLEHLLSEIGYRGIFSAEFKVDQRDGLFKLIEINARAWWYVEFAQRCGVDVCSMAYRDALELPVDPAPGYQVGRRCGLLMNDLRACKDQSRLPGASWWSMLGVGFGSDSTPFHWSDPGPIWHQVSAGATSFVRSRFRRTFR